MCAARVTSGGLPGPLVGLLGERALGPVDPAVGPGVRAVQVVGAAGERLALEPFLAPVGDAVAVGVGQLPDARRRGDVERAVEPHRPLGEHHLVGEDDALVEAAVAVGVFEADDPVRALFELDLHLLVGSGGVGDVEPALLVEVGDDRPIDERRPGNQLDLESRGHGHLGRRGLRRFRAGEENRREHDCGDSGDGGVTLKGHRRAHHIAAGPAGVRPGSDRGQTGSDTGTV